MEAAAGELLVGYSWFLVVDQRSNEVAWWTKLPQGQQFGPGWLSMSLASRSRRTIAAEEGPPFSEKITEVVLCPGWPGEPSLWGSCRKKNNCCNGFFQERVRLHKQPFCTCSRLRFLREIGPFMAHVRAQSRHVTQRCHNSLR